MRLATQLRIAPAVWLTPVMTGLVVLYVAQSITFAPREPYVLGLTARAMNVLGLAVPVFAAAAAWEAGRLARGGAWDMPIVRHRLSVAGWAVAPAIVGGSLVILIAVLQVLTYEGLLLPDLGVMALAVALLVSHVLAGFGVGLWLKRVVAVPLVLLVSFAWFVLPRVSQIQWPRHVTGTSLELCCSPYEVLAPVVGAGLLIVAAGLAIAAAVLIVRRPAGRSLAILAATPLVTAIVLGAAVAAEQVGPAAARTDPADACRSGERVTVCVWPEHAPGLPFVVSVADEVVGRWQRAGITVPTVFREGPVADADEAARIRLWARSDRHRVLQELVGAVVPPYWAARPPACARTEPWPSAIASPYLSVWLSTVAGMPESIRRFQFEGDERPDSDYFADTPREAIVPVRPLVDRVLALPRDEQAAWVEANLEALGRCRVEAPLDPG
jgi:hypothetical protein